ncbi:hypothetical protein BpHYR1_023715 [Brachionus plicatilis]|uniref:Uncharacterized protein n=1 Tax=Brachionus plicatilis TaxID=10195 RepID=A0A3M7RUA2_BRAPC|nr:hypothetical protein BpHYR1_023715 [Brachionus plicatilis]
MTVKNDIHFESQLQAGGINSLKISKPKRFGSDLFKINLANLTGLKLFCTFFKHNINATYCNIQSCTNCQSLLMMYKISAKCTAIKHIEI